MHKKTDNQIRIIGGLHRSRKLPVLCADGLRPTSNRMKETLFNWLSADIAQSRCLDLFAGTGSLGLEALSRSAKHVDFVELNLDIALQIKRNLTTLSLHSHAKVMHTDALYFLNQAPDLPYDIIFIDPPFALNLHQTILDGLAQHLWALKTALNANEEQKKESSNRMFKKETLIFLEMPTQNMPLVYPHGLQPIKEASTLYSKIQLLKIIF